MNSYFHQRAPLPALIAALLIMSGCSPSLSPLYRDYEVSPADSSIDDRITAALVDAGWDTLESDIPNTIATESRTLSRWGLYRVTASLEVTPLGPDHVRVFVHPFRRYITGGKGKIPYLTPGVRSKFLPGLTESLREQGLVAVGTPIERDEETVP